MGFFDGASKTKAGHEGGRLGPGTYPALELIEARVNNDGHHGTKAFYTFRVLEQAAPDPHDVSGKPPTPVGGEGCIGIQLDGQYRKSALSETNAIVGAILGFDIDKTNENLELVERESERAIGKDQPFRGRVISGKVFTKVTRNDRQIVKITSMGPFVGRMGTGEGPKGGDRTETAPAAAPSAPSAPAAPAPKPFRPEDFGWALHTDPGAAAAGWYYKGQEVKTADQIRAAVGA